VRRAVTGSGLTLPVEVSTWKTGGYAMSSDRNERAKWNAALRDKAARTAPLALAAAVALSCADRAERPAAEVEYLSTPEMEALGLPFSEAVRVGDMLYLSGQIGNRPGTLELVAGGIEAEARQTLDNIQAVLERYGSGLDRVVKCTIYLADIDEWPALNGVYAEYFAGEKPARAAVAGSGLALGARVEIDCIATVGDGGGR
jgi:reactive intermediate/imine deaminase